MKKKVSREEANRFTCPVCGEEKLRGVYIRVKDGPCQGWEVKVCGGVNCILGKIKIKK